MKSNKDLRNELYQELEDLHKQQRGWQRLVKDEELDYNELNKLSIFELSLIIELLKKENKK